MASTMAAIANTMIAPAGPYHKAIRKLHDSKVKKKRSIKDPVKNDETIIASRKRLAVIEKEEKALKTKIGNRARVLAIETALSVINSFKWNIQNVDYYRRNENFFQISLSVHHEVSEDDVIRDASYGENKLNELIEIMELYEVYSIPYDGCAINLGYDSITISAESDNSRDVVFAAIKKLKLKLDLASFVKSMEFAESEMASRKKLAEELSSTILFAI